jgi:hypothetical protein
MYSRRRRINKKTRKIKGGMYNASKGSRFIYIERPRTGKTGTVKTNINDDHILVEFNHPKTVEIIKKEHVNSMGEPCNKACATCACLPHKTSGANMQRNQPPIENSLPKHPNNNVKSHFVWQGDFAIEPVKFPLYTHALVTCSALMMDIHSDRGIMHFLTHISGGEPPEKIEKMVRSIRSHCGRKQPSSCINNIKIWAGAGPEKERGMYLENPNEVSMPVIINILTSLDLIDIKPQGSEEKIYYKDTDVEIPLVKMCFKHYVGK